MAVEPMIHCGKYEAAYYLQDEEMAKSYLEECVKEAVHGGIAEKDALPMEIRNILDFAKFHYDAMTLRRIHTLLNRALKG